MLDILLNVLVGVAVGYASYKVVEALLPKFLSLWEGFVEAVEEIFAYVTETTKEFLAGLAEFFQDQWSELRAYLIDVFGYISDCIIFLFKQDAEVHLGFMNPVNEEITIGSIGVAPHNVQLPERQILAMEVSL